MVVKLWPPKSVINAHNIETIAAAFFQATETVTDFSLENGKVTSLNPHSSRKNVGGGISKQCSSELSDTLLKCP